jgi:hypothetical protein
MLTGHPVDICKIIPNNDNKKKDTPRQAVMSLNIKKAPITYITVPYITIRDKKVLKRLDGIPDRLRDYIVLKLYYYGFLSH